MNIKVLGNRSKFADKGQTGNIFLYIVLDALIAVGAETHLSGNDAYAGIAYFNAVVCFNYTTCIISNTGG
jgi:hypothetical protein